MMTGATTVPFERAEAWAGMDARIRLSRSPSSGRGQARNLAVEQARGEVIVICDGDDISHSHRFARIARALEQADVTWSVGRGSGTCRHQVQLNPDHPG